MLNEVMVNEVIQVLKVDYEPVASDGGDGGGGCVIDGCVIGIFYIYVKLLCERFSLSL